MKYWIAIGEETWGPYAVEEIEEMVREGRFARDVPAMPEDGEAWTPLSNLVDLSAIPVPAPRPLAKPMPSMQRRSPSAMTSPVVAPEGEGAVRRPVAISQPSSVGPVVIILIVIAVLALGGGIFVYQHSQNLKAKEAEAAAKAAARKQAEEAAAKEAAERVANPALALEGAPREQVIAALKKAEMVVIEKPFQVNMSMMPREDFHVAMIKSLKDLEVLHLGAGNLTDPGLQVLSGLETLRVLSIGAEVKSDAASESKQSAAPVGSLKITDASLDHLKKLKGLRKLYLWNCGITDEGLETLDEFPGLSDLELIDTAVTEAAARAFSEEHPAIAVTVRGPGFTIEP